MLLIVFSSVSSPAGEDLLYCTFFFLMIRRPPRPTLFPYTTLSDLAQPATGRRCVPLGLRRPQQRLPHVARLEHLPAAPRCLRLGPTPPRADGLVRGRRREGPRVQRGLVARRRPDDRCLLGLGRPEPTEHDPPDLRRRQQPVPPDGEPRPSRIGIAANVSHRGSDGARTV